MKNTKAAEILRTFRKKPQDILTQRISREKLLKDRNTLILTFLTSKNMTLIDMKSATITAKGQVSLPKTLREQAGIIEGSKVAILSYEDRIEIRPLRVVEQSMETAFASEASLSKEWNNSKEDAAWKQL